MKNTETMIRLLQRALNALTRGTGLKRLAADGRAGHRTFAALIRFLAAHGPAGEARLVRAVRALVGPMDSVNIGNIGDQNDP